MTNKSSSESLCSRIKRFNLQEKRDLQQWLESQIELEQAVLSEGAISDSPAVESAKVSATNRAIVESCSYEGRTYQLERRRCGKKACKCAGTDLRSVGHGPYWYSYWKESGKLKTQYIGKRPPWQRS
ncbi:hypothetical protein LEP3755_66260 (plasmid) [Leptolyngbya sp. NIES-3755]|nr:hypothetical protein LEP3755_66260 [Leptolyngbya sp. NIES-3755]